MKKFILLLSSVLVLTSCSQKITPTPTPEPTPSTIPYQQLANGKCYKLDSLSLDNGIIPNDVINLCLNYISALAKINQSLKPANYITVYDKEDNKSDIYTEFETYLNDYNCRVYITTKNNKLYKWYVSFDMNKDKEYIKDIFAATIMVANNNSITPEDAKKQAQPIADTYPTSKHFDINNYIAYIAHYGSKNAFIFDELIIFDKNNLTPTEDELSQYAELSYDTAKNAEMNTGMKDVLHGIVDTYTMDNISQINQKIYFLFTADDGQQYKMYYDFTKIPQTIDTQKQYTMYCTVQEDALSDYDKPMLSVDYCIED